MHSFAVHINPIAPFKDNRHVIGERGIGGTAILGADQESRKRQGLFCPLLKSFLPTHASWEWARPLARDREGCCSPGNEELSRLFWIFCGAFGDENGPYQELLPSIDHSWENKNEVTYPILNTSKMIKFKLLCPIGMYPWVSAYVDDILSFHFRINIKFMFSTYNILFDDIQMMMIDGVLIICHLAITCSLTFAAFSFNDFSSPRPSRLHMSHWTYGCLRTALTWQAAQTSISGSPWLTFRVPFLPPKGSQWVTVEHWIANMYAWNKGHKSKGDGWGRLGRHCQIRKLYKLFEFFWRVHQIKKQQHPRPFTCF